MIKETDVTSGFDVEVLLGSNYIRNILLSAFDSGDFPARTTLNLAGNNIGLGFHPPTNIRRRYAPLKTKLPPAVNGSFQVDILFNDPLGADLRIQLVGDISLTLAGSGVPIQFPLTTITLRATFALQEALDAQDNVIGSTLQVNVVDVVTNDPTVNIIINTNFALVLTSVNDLIAGVIPTDVFGGGNNIQSAKSRKFEGDDKHDDAIGFYLNFLWRDGPNASDFRPDRGDVSKARNYLNKNQDIAFSMPGSVYEFLSVDTLNRLAMPIYDNSEEIYYPIPASSDGDDQGEIFSVDIGHDRTRYTLDDGEKSGLVDALRVKIKGQYFQSAAYKPNFTLTIHLIPVVKKGLLSWRVEYDIDVGLLAEALPFLIFYSLAFLFGVPGLMIGVQLAALGILGQEYGVEPLAMEQLAGELDAQAEEATSLLDAIPHRVLINAKRWDPFYVTDHQVLAPLDFFVLDADGIRLHGKTALDKEVRPLEHVLVRTEERDESLGSKDNITHLLYRVKDHKAHSATFTENLPATDRRDFEQITEEGKGTELFRLSLAQIEERKETGRLHGPVVYLPEHVDIRQNQVRRILAISQTERDELENDLINKRRDFLRDREIKKRGRELMGQILPELVNELGDKPTSEEITERLYEVIDADTESELDRYIENLLPQQLEDAIQAAEKLDLSPHEFGTFEQQRILAIRGYERIKRINTYYYRDKADSSLEDNLMSLPGYRTEDIIELS